MSLFQRLSDRRQLQHAADNLYGAIVAQARRPQFYSVLGVPDTLTGRFEMLALHLFVLVERMRDRSDGPIMQAVIDTFFSAQEWTMREMGVGDLSVPKRMHRLADDFYARAAQYRECIDTHDQDALARVIAAGVLDHKASESNARAMADYVRSALDLLNEQTEEAFCAGHIAFPEPPAFDSDADAERFLPPDTGLNDR